MPVMNSEAIAIIKVIRSIVQSRKDPIPINDITRDFRALEGTFVPFKKFGYQSLEEFLKCSGEFNFRVYGGEVKVFVIPSQDSQHIMNMISKQKSNKTRGGGAFLPIAQAPKRKTSNSGSNWNRSAYAQNYSKMPTPTKQHSQTSYYANNYNSYNRSSYTVNVNNNRNQQPSFSSIQQQANRHILGMIENSLRSNISTNNVSNVSYNKPRIEPPKKTSSPPPLQRTFSNPLAQKQPSLQNQPPAQKQQPLPQKQPIIQPPPQKQQPLLQKQLAPQILPVQQQVVSSIAQRLQRALPQQDNKVAEPPKPKTPPVQETNNNTNSVKNMNLAQNDLRLKLLQPTFDSKAVDQQQTPTSDMIVNFKPAGYREDTIVKPKKKAVQPPLLEILPKRSLQDRLNINKDDTQVEQSNLPIEAKEPVTPETFVWTKQGNPIEELANYCLFHNYNAPQYKYFGLPENRINCRVTINKIIYGDYPNDYATKNEAQLGAAYSAVMSIQVDECNDTLDSVQEDEIVPKLYEMLKQVPNGIFRKSIPDEFQKKYNMSLPESWFKIIAQDHKFTVEELIKDKEIIFINSGDQQNISTSEKDTEIGKPRLPWEERHWNLYITNPISTREIWARLIGPEYSDKMDELITEIEMTTMDNTKLADKHEIGCHYLAYYLESWHRIRIDNIDNENNTVFCFFIDHGDSEYVEMTQIYECNSEFLQLPGQAICFALEGLEDLDGNPNAKCHLMEELGTKIVIGEVLTKRDEFTSEEFDGSIRVVLYDTSSDVDVNLNPLIMKRICEDIPIPTLDRKAVNFVTITHVDDDAFTYCQVKNPNQSDAMQYLQILINNLVQSKILEKKHQGLYGKGDKSGLYLIFDVKDKKWYRARIDSSLSKQQYSMFCVDYGFTRIVDSSNIYRLDSLSVALQRYPDQAIKTLQFNLPEINDYILGRLKGLLKPNINAMVRVCAHLENVPEVRTYLRSEQDKIPFCVTDLIKLECELSETSHQDLSEHRMKNSSSQGGSSSTTGASIMGNASSQSDFNVGSNSSINDNDEIIDKFGKFHIKTQKYETVQWQPIPKFDLPKFNDIFNVIVTIASSPSYFIVQPYNCYSKLNELMSQLQHYCSSTDLLRPDQLKVGEYYAGLSTEDELWYRVQVDNFIVDQCISVRLVDFGRVFVLDGTKHFKALPPSLRELPQQAVKAKLYGVKPKNGDWTADDAVHFGEITNSKSFAAVVKDVQKDEINQRDQVVILRLIDVSTKDDIYMDQVLVDEGRAILCA